MRISKCFSKTNEHDESPKDGDDASNESSETFHGLLDQAEVLDPWEMFKQFLLSSPNRSLTEAAIKQNFVPLTHTDTGCFLTVAAALFEPLDINT